jgi:cytochrome P450
MTASNAGMFDPFELTPDVDRYALFARYRDSAPLARGVKPFPSADEPFYAFSHRLITDVLRHPDMLQAPPGDYLKIREELGRNSFWTMMFRTVLLADPPRHGELRRYMSKDFSSKAIATLESALRTKADELAAKCRADGGFDLITDFSIPFIFAGLEQILGIPLEDPTWLKRLTSSLADGLDFTTETERTSANAASDDICAFIESLIPRTSSGYGLMSVLVRMRDERSISHADLVANIAFLLFAGQETIVDMIGNAVMALHEIATL